MSKFTAEERIKIVLLYLNGHESISDLAQEVQVNKSVISGFMNIKESKLSSKTIQAIHRSLKWM